MEEWEPVRFVVQLACILVAAGVAGHAARTYLKLPALIGEITAGILLGPFALGSLPLLGGEALFPLHGGSPVSVELQAFSVLAAVLLLFAAGLEADLRAFISHSVSSMAVGLGGVVVSFAAGAGFAVLAGLADGWGDSVALFLGAATSATSIGVTARLLADRNRAASPEGVTIMGAAVLDDILVILILSIVLGTAETGGTGSDVWRLAVFAFGAWLVFFTFSLLAARPLSKWLKRSREPMLMASLALGIALLIAGLFEMAGLSIVLGAYVAGISLSQTDVVDVIHERLNDVYHMIVPIFFCVLGMHVNPRVLLGVLGLSLVYTAISFPSKIVGAGIPALLTGYNLRGALRIGTGMVPRGEVALIIATLGLSSGLIGEDVFSIVMTMTLVTTLVGPYLFNRSLEGLSGLRKDRGSAAEDVLVFSHTFPDPDIAFLLMSRIIRGFRNEEFFVHLVPGNVRSGSTIRQDDMVIFVRQEDDRVEVRANQEGSGVARWMVLEELLQFEDIANSFREIGDLSTAEQKLFKDVSE